MGLLEGVMVGDVVAEHGGDVAEQLGDACLGRIRWISGAVRGQQVLQTLEHGEHGDVFFVQAAQNSELQGKHGQGLSLIVARGAAVDQPPDAQREAGVNKSAEQTGDPAQANGQGRFQSDARPDQHEGQGVEQGMGAQQALGRQFARPRRLGPGPRGVHGPEERQDALQNTEKEGEQPAEQREKDEQARTLDLEEAEGRDQADDQARDQEPPARAQEKRRHAQVLAHAGRQTTHHAAQMQRGAQESEKHAAGRQERHPVVDPDGAGHQPEGAQREDGPAFACRYALGEREERHQDVAEAEREQPHEAEPGDDQVDRGRARPFVQEAVIVVHDQNDSERDADQEGRERRQAETAQGLEGARAPQDLGDEDDENAEAQRHRKSAQGHKQVLGHRHAPDQDAGAGDEEPGCDPGRLGAAQRRSRRHRQHLKGGPHGRGREHAERQAVQRRQRRPGAAGENRRIGGKGRDQRPEQDVESQRGGEVAIGYGRVQEAVPGPP